MDGILTVVGAISGNLAELQSLTGNLSGESTLTGAITTAERVVNPTYTGKYGFTPTQETQIVPIEGLTASQDITINPIPSNYGLITWNGSTLTVS